MQTTRYRPGTSYWPFLFLFVALKLALNLLAGGHYGFHRDELLHLVLGDHLDWGYKEVPPFIALLAKVSSVLFGSSVFAARVFTALASALMVWFTGLLVIEFGGRRFAIATACLAMIFSPGMVASGYLFQPVVFDQLWWLLSAYLTVKFVNTSQAKYLYWLGVVTGLGLLTKYTMAFFSIALLLGLLITPQRKLLWRRETLLTFGIAILIFLPNVIWQYLHHWPLITHMHNLKKQQLDFVNPSDFAIQQLFMHGASVLIWLAGLLCLLFHKQLARYRFVAFAYILVFLFLFKMNGKAYYLLAAYPMLFAAGGFGLERLLKFYILRAFALILFVLPNLVLLPVVLPVLPLDNALGFFSYFGEKLRFMDFAVTWEDHKKHRTTQDYADMLGWDEMANRVADTYHALPPEEQKQTVIFADNYGEAGALHHYGKQYGLPEVVCLNSSFALWAPDSLRAKNLIYVSDDNDVSDLTPMAESIERTGGVENKLAREYGVGVFLIKNANDKLETAYQKDLAASKLE